MKASGPTGGPMAWPPARTRCRPAGWPSGWPERPLRRCGVPSDGNVRRALDKHLSRSLPVRRAHVGIYQQRATALRPGNAGTIQRKVPLCLPACRLREAAPLPAGPHAAGRAGRRSVPGQYGPPAMEWLDNRPRRQPAGRFPVGRGRAVGPSVADRVSPGLRAPARCGGTDAGEPGRHVPRNGHGPQGPLLGRATRRRHRAAAAPA